MVKTEHAQSLAGLQEYSLGNARQNVEMTVYTMFSFLLPIVLSHPQIVVGIAVNAMLVLAGLNLKGYRLLPVIIAPSLGALSGAALFGPFTHHLLYLAPFIWAGNAVLVLSFKLFRLNKGWNYWVTLGAGSALKSGFLFLSALLLYSLGIIPAMFLTAMGIMQLITAVCGGTGAYALQYSKKRLSA